MLRLTKIFHFEMAHAIHGYEGPCKHIHGHSYELHVTVSSCKPCSGYLPGKGFEIDFAAIKQLAQTHIIGPLDHALVLSEAFQKAHMGDWQSQKLLTWEVEPTAENLLLYMAGILEEKLDNGIVPVYMRLYETPNSYAEWMNDNIFNLPVHPDSLLHAKY